MMDKKAIEAALARMPADEIVRLSEASVVKSLSVAIDLDRKAVIWNFVFQSGNADVFFLTEEAAMHFTKSIRWTAREFKWEADAAAGPIEAQHIREEWKVSQIAKVIGPAYRAEVFRDAVIVSLQVGRDTFRAIRFPPGHALRLADIMWRERQKAVQSFPGSTALH